MQFAVLRPMEDFLGLALAMSMAMLPCCYFANSRNPSTMISGLFGGMIIIGLMDLSLQQSYSFSGFANNVIGYSGGFLIPMLVLQLFVAATPEQTFCKTVSSFFQACEQSLDHLSADPPWTDRGQKVLGASHAVLVKSFKMSGLWSKLLNHRRISKDDLSKIGRLLVHMQALMIRREMMERTRIKLISKSELGDLTTAEQQLRKSLSGFLAEIHAVVQSIDGQPDLEAALARQQEVRQLLEPLQNQVSSRTQSGEQDYPAIVLTSYYRAVTDAIDQCFEDMQTIDWKRLQQSYI